MVAQELEGVAAFLRGQPLGQETLQLDRAHLRAVLLALGAALGHGVVVEPSRQALGLAVEEVDEGPEQVGQFVLQPRADQQAGQCLEDGAEGHLRRLGLGQRPRVGLVAEGAVGEGGEFVEEVGGGRGGEGAVVCEEVGGEVLVGHGVLPFGWALGPRRLAAFTATDRHGSA